MYSGVGGYLTAYLRVLSILPSLSIDQEKLEQITKRLEKQIKSTVKVLEKKCEIDMNKILSGDRAPYISYFFGIVGIDAHLCNYYLNIVKLEGEFEKKFMRLIKFENFIEEDLENECDELLYGISGYVYCLLYVYKHCLEGNQLHSGKVKKIAELTWKWISFMFARGVSTYEEKKGLKVDFRYLSKNFRLVFYFHGKEYFGAAHGLAGILTIIMESIKIFRDFYKEFNPMQLSKIELAVKHSLLYLINSLSPDGNLPSSSKKKSESRLVAFCHGAPGFITPLALSLETLKILTKHEQKIILVAIEKCQKCVWKKGILLKGWGLCHGISGNGYPFLRISRSEIIHEKLRMTGLYKAVMFSLCKGDASIFEKVENYDHPSRYVVGLSDHPMSLMTGKAGDLSFYADTLSLILSKKCKGYVIVYYLSINF